LRQNSTIFIIFVDFCHKNDKFRIKKLFVSSKRRNFAAEIIAMNIKGIV